MSMIVNWVKDIVLDVANNPFWKQKDFMLTILSSTVVTTVLGNVIQVFSVRFDRKSEKEKICEEREYKEKQDKENKKEKIYKKVLIQSLTIKNILEEFRSEQGYDTEQLKNMLKQVKKATREVIPELQIYSSKGIVESFIRMNRFIRAIDIGVEITEGHLEALDSEYNFLMKLIKKDLEREHL